MAQVSTAFVSSSKVDPKRRMSLKGPPLRVVVKESVVTSKPAPAAPAVSRLSTVGTTTAMERRQSIAARAVAKQPAPRVVAAAPPQTALKTNDNSISLIVSRLDAMERQITELQQVIGKVAILEELVRPIKPILSQNQIDIAALKENVCNLNQSVSMHEKKIKKQGTQMEATSRRTSQAFEDVRSGSSSSFPMSPGYSFHTLDSSVKSNEGTNENYTSTFKLSTIARTTGSISPPSSPTPQTIKPLSLRAPHHDISAVENHLPNSLNNVKAPTVSTAPSKPAVGVQMGGQDQSLPVLELPTQRLPALEVADKESIKPVESLQPSNLSASIADGAVQTRRKRKQSGGSSPDCVPGDSMFTMMDVIAKEERSNVTMWLGVDFQELNRAVTVLNEFANNQRFEMSTLTEFYITEEDVATQCGVESRKAKAIVLLLCKLKRLQLRRTENIAVYRLLAGTTLESR